MEVKGCRIGKSQDALDAVRSFLGGEAQVDAPTTYQGFDTIQVPGPLFADKEAAYDALIGSKADLPEALVCRPGETKAACLTGTSQAAGSPPSFSFATDG